jgi:hypothetical protein
MQVSPVGSKPHFSITLPEAGLSTKWPLMSDLMSVVSRMWANISRSDAVQMP